MHKKSKQPLFRYMAKRRIFPSILLIAILLLFYFILMKMTINNNSETRRQHQYERLQQSVQEIEYSLTEIFHGQHKILNSRAFSQFVYMYDDLDWYKRYELQELLSKELLALKNESDYIKSVWLYVPGMEKAISDARVNPPAPEWLLAYESGSDALQTIGQQIIYFAEHADPVSPTNQDAYIAVILDESSLLDRLSYIRRSDRDEILLIWNHEEDTLHREKYEPEGDCLLISNDQFPFDVLYILYNDEVDTTIQQLIYLLYIFLVIMLLCEVFIFANWYRDIYAPLHKLLIDAFGRAEQGDFKYRITISKESPFRPIYDSYNQMMAKTEYYVENELKQQLLVSRANLKQLQAQISPHFMYNSYFILFRLIKKGDQESSLLLCEHLGQFYHYITRNADDEKRLCEEVEHARHYAAIQQFRFRGMLDIQIESPAAEIAGVYVPRLILQPLLENAFKYAYETERGGGIMMLRVSFCVFSPESFDIIVENSGNVTDETIELIRQRLASCDEPIETTALVNIHRRLQIYFNSQSALSVERSALGGLLVRMHIDDTREEV